MSNLPILNQTAQGKPARNHAAAIIPDIAAQGAPLFGEMLALQLGDITAGKKSDRVAPDALAAFGDDLKSAVDATPVQANERNLPEAAAPGDFLETLLPQVAENAAQAFGIVPARQAGDKASDAADAAPSEIVPTPLPQPAAAVAPINIPVQATTPTTNTPAAELSSPAKPAAAASAPTGKLQLPPAAANAKPDTTTSQPSVTKPATPGMEGHFAQAINTVSENMPAKFDWSDSTPAVPQAAAPGATAMPSVANPVSVPAAQLAINTPVGQNRWADEFSQKITWLATGPQDQRAELHLNPPQLGPLDVVLKVSGDQATAVFSSPHAAVREAIEQSIPRLREMMADNGIMLGNTSVGDQTAREQRGEFGDPRQAAPGTRPAKDVPIPAPLPSMVSTISRHNGIVDTFA